MALTIARATLLVGLLRIQLAGLRLYKGGLGAWGGSILRVTGFADVDTALEVRAVLDGNARCGLVSGQRAFAADIDAIAGLNIAAHFAQNNHLAGSDIGCDLAITTDGDAVAWKVDCAFDFAVDVERLRSR